MGLKNVVLASGVSLFHPDFKLNVIEESTFKGRFYPGAKQVSYEEINQAVFGSRFIKRFRSWNKGMNMSDQI